MDSQKFDQVYDDYYFHINKSLQLLSGLWPYKSGKEKTFRRSVVYTILLFFIIPQVNGVRKWYGIDLDIFMECLAGVIYGSAVFLKYWTTVLSEMKIKNVYNTVAQNWMTITDPDERRILTEYAKQGRIISIGYIVLMTSAGTAFCMLPFYTSFLDIVIPLNHSREKRMILRGEYFLDQKKYYFHINIFLILFGAFTLVVFTSIDTTYTVIVHQNLAIFSIVRHRLQKLTKNCNIKEDHSHRMIIKAISLHKEALQFINIIDSSYSLCFFVLIGLSILIISIVAVLIMSLEVMYDVIRTFMFETGLMMHLFYISWPGQKVLDHSSELFVHVYTSEWYNVSEKGKKLLRFMMLRCLKPCTLSAGRLYIMNFANYGSVIKTAMSYITVIASFRDE